MPTYPSPSLRYLEEVESGSINLDQSQLQALRVLDDIRAEVLEANDKPKPSSMLRGWFHRLLDSQPAESIRGLYLWGGVGTGKTLIMDMFYKSMPENLAMRTHFHRFMQSVHNQKKDIHDTVDPLEIIASKLASEYRVLCLDEFTVSDITDAMIMSGLLHHLFSKHVVLITTSNTEIDLLYKNGLQRSRFLPAIELLNQHTKSMRVDEGKDYRMAFLQKNTVFNMPADQNSFQQLQAAFQQLSDDDGHAETLSNISVNDRKIEVIAVSLGVVWFDFDAICRSNRSNSDFIEIAKQFHTVLISGIPSLSATDDDATRRFIELIDELYDRNVNLLVSSDNPPHQIYSGNRLAQPFQRTASRLTEMSSETYLGLPHLA